ncbi:MAG: initiation control protein YabA [Aerococcaceae bacterium]|nr:initiation control protein YabA [Aerococcaceae bacterium]
MEQYEIQQLLASAETQLIGLGDTIAQLKAACDELREENNRLRMMNHDLHDLVDALAKPEMPVEQKQAPVLESGTLNGRERLQTFYNEGVHVCHMFFGSRREPDEECMFCQSVIDGLPPASR